MSPAATTTRECLFYTDTLHYSSKAAPSILCYVTPRVPPAPERDHEPCSSCVEYSNSTNCNFLWNMRNNLMYVLCIVPHSPAHNIHTRSLSHPCQSQQCFAFLQLRMSHIISWPPTPKHEQPLPTQTQTMTSETTTRCDLSIPTSLFPSSLANDFEDSVYLVQVLRNCDGPSADVIRTQTIYAASFVNPGWSVYLLRERSRVTCKIDGTTIATTHTLFNSSRPFGIFCFVRYLSDIFGVLLRRMFSSVL